MDTRDREIQFPGSTHAGDLGFKKSEESAFATSEVSRGAIVETYI